MTKRLFLAALALGIAWAGTASAGARVDKANLKRVSGTFVSVAIEGATAKWKLNVEEEAGKIKEMTFDMPAAVVVFYTEKNGLRIVHQVRQGGGRVAEKAKGLTAQGTLLKAEPQGNRIAFSIKSGEGENAGQQDFTISNRLNIAYQDGQPAVIVTIHPEGRGKEKGEGGEKPRGNKPDKTTKEAPENF